ncbi:MAG: hypothetical protein V1820_04370 [archaeon]
MAVSLQIGYVVIIVAVLAALITGKREPIFWALLFFIGATAIAYAGIFTAKKVTKAQLGEIKPPKE